MMFFLHKNGKRQWVGIPDDVPEPFKSVHRLYDHDRPIELRVDPIPSTFKEAPFITFILRTICAGTTRWDEYHEEGCLCDICLEVEIMTPRLKELFCRMGILKPSHLTAKEISNMNRECEHLARKTGSVFPT